MMSFALNTILFSDLALFGVSRLGAASRRRGSVDTGEMLTWLLIAAVVIGGVSLALYAASRAAHRRRGYSHAAVFSGLCKTHQLSLTARRLLKKVAQQHRLTEPARVFTEPKWLDPTGLRGALRSKAEAVASLRDRMFR